MVTVVTRGRMVALNIIKPYLTVLQIRFNYINFVAFVNTYLAPYIFWALPAMVGEHDELLIIAPGFDQAISEGAW